MAPLKLQGKPAIFIDYLDKSNLSHVGLKNPRANFETITGYSENDILFAIAAVDLYLCNRAPNLYSNHKALELLLMGTASRWGTHLTDRSLLEVVRKLSKTLRGYKLPAAISAALDKLDFIIKNFSTDSICDSHHALHPEDWDLLTDVDGMSFHYLIKREKALDYLIYLVQFK
ncbi:Aste57867_18046 [Aphanomyces stellatus]|uniref:Aste57867_18046 protein n=1 Tax=Aphanomyces stellatus TaxID=120398 RepID=A0A485L9Y5_9STRA|nr:hypothetical protein As57867_017984 [Aphanomyces stellatus]VFT94785.1 Aste57867_18046 [Aphanomyces stellatus]